MSLEDTDAVSIALCTFNGGRYLEAQLESFLAQNRLPDELVVSDDCSTDETIEILETFQKKAPFGVRIFRNELNLGYAKNFEQTLLRCSGAIIFPSDQDDVWHPEKIERLAAVLNESEQVQMVVSNAELVDDSLAPLSRDLFDLLGVEKSRIESLQENPLESLLFGRNFVSGNTLALRASLCDRLKKHPIPLGSAHDHWLGVMCALTSQLRLFDFKGIQYRQHQAQVFGAGIAKRQQRKSKSPFRQQFVSVCETAENQRLSYESLLTSYDYQHRSVNVSPNVAGRIKQNREAISRKISDLRSQVLHFRLRSELAYGRLNRIPSILAELGTGRYTKYSRGFASAILDLVRS